MSTIKAVLFDFGGTLDNDGVDWFARLHRGIVKRNGALREEVFEECAREAATAISLLEDTRRLGMKGLASRLGEHIHRNLAAYFRREGVAAEMAWTSEEVVEEFMGEAQGYLARNREVLEQLRADYRLGCISNNWGNTAGWCGEFGLDNFFETMVDSTVVGSVKPDGKIFQAALEAMGLRGEDCVYVGDNYICDVVGSTGAGMQAVWMVGAEGKTPGSQPCQKQAGSAEVEGIRAIEIKSLPELLRLEWPQG